MAGYYRRFIRLFGVIAKPLTELLKKDSFGWNPQAQHAFESLKLALSSAPVLALPDHTKPFTIETDASAKGLGAVLMQEKHPIAFISKALSPKQQTLSVYEKELLAILMAVKQWHYYLIIGRFTIRTDQQSLKYLLGQKVTTPLQHTWLAKLMGYDYEIEYKQVNENVAVDALSRVSLSLFFTLAVSSFEAALMTKIQDSWAKDLEVSLIWQQLQEGQRVGHFKWDGALLTWKNRVVVGNYGTLREDIVRVCHSSPMGSHSGIHATRQRLKGIFYWKGISKSVRNILRNCDVCKRAKGENVASPGLLQPLPILSLFFLIFLWTSLVVYQKLWVRIRFL